MQSTAGTAQARNRAIERVRQSSVQAVILSSSNIACNKRGTLSKQKQLEALGECKSSLGVCTQRAQTSNKATVCYQSLMARYLYHPQSFLKISLKSVHNFLSNPANKQANTNLRKGHRSLPKFDGMLLVPSSINPENFIEIHS